MQIRSRLTANEYIAGILAGDRVLLSQAITVTESTLPADEQLSTQIIEGILHAAGKSVRIGITGVPGVGKSTFIEAFGKAVIEHKHKVAVLTIDPSSPLTRGSILGDKTRMDDLSKNPNAFIRPSATGNTLGGVALKTRESILLCEAAGFDVIIVETVGVGQSEIAVKKMVDFFLLLVLAGGGDELQGIKKGIMEMADGIVVTKSDGDNVARADQARSDYSHALHLSLTPPSGWTTPVLKSSAVTGDGIREVWDTIKKHKDQMMASGFFQANRSDQQKSWFQESFNYLVLRDVHTHHDLRKKFDEIETALSESTVSPQHAAAKMLLAYHQLIRETK